MNTPLVRGLSVAAPLAGAYDQSMIFSEFVEKALKRARYELIEDKTYFGRIPGFRGVWANAKNLEACRKELREVLEDWLILKIRDREKIPGFPVHVDRRHLVRDA